jgi:hypothetical protein
VKAPVHARSLVSHFQSNPTVQETGLSEGTRDSDQKPVSIELVIGRREEVYWEKVPLKVKQKLLGQNEEVEVRTKKKRRGK